MTYFNLPDLGEGLPEAEIREWYVAVGDTVKADQPIVSMETAKAVVDVPSPQAGVIAELCGQANDIIKTGAPLFAFVDDKPVVEPSSESHAATVAGRIEAGDTVINEAATGVVTTAASQQRRAMLPAMRLLAEAFELEPDTIPATGDNNTVTIADLKQAIIQQLGATTAAAKPVSPAVDYVAKAKSLALDSELTPLRGVRRAMANAMRDSHERIVPVTLADDANISGWKNGTDTSLRVIRAVQTACQAEPNLNAWFDDDNQQRLVHQVINLGLAMDSPEGLFVPVLKDIAKQDADQLRASIDRFKTEVADRSIPTDDLQGATIMLSNFGVFAGRYANPVLSPPCVAIIGTGKIREQAMVVDGKLVAARVLPISVTVDHRVITGGELARFLRALLDDLQA